MRACARNARRPTAGRWAARARRAAGRVERELGGHRLGALAAVGEQRGAGDRAGDADGGADPQRVLHAVHVGLRVAAERVRGGHERAQRGDADGDAGLAERVVDARGEAAHLLRRRAQRDGAEGRVEEPGADAGDDHAGQEHRPRGVDRGERQQRLADADEQQAAGDHAPGADLLDEVRGRAGDDEHDQRAGQVDEPGLDRRQAEDLLQVDRRVEEHGEERRGDGDRRRPARR